ncbi:hypothetical protein DBW_1855 [Desulfuromonas sp. DDH964]|uniref:S8 family peptidase n=1 Tax=Desulfuromonas sp. DDH964 TaxID=1823759 RepID=UPI00078D668B|nr:S8 family peptidase [Desulfuromonas sp. DDH964]AMV72209.1 hypothetical protein DBW_1855 [Desulfuromonas sp. DDH964]
MKQPNFLIGRGQLLTYPVEVKKGFNGKAEVYSFDDALARLTPQISRVSEELDSLPDHACPNGFGVARFVLNPTYIAKSFYPSTFLRSTGLVAVGSRSVRVTPDKWSKKGKPSECSSTEIFVAGEKSRFRNLITALESMDQETREAKDFTHFERISSFTSDEKFRPYALSSDHYFEVGVHLLPGENPFFIQRPFQEYARQLGLKVHSDLSVTAGNLWFVPVEGSLLGARKLSQFSFIRVVRPLPRLRALRPMQRSNSVTLACDLPDIQPLSSKPRVGILDGGLPSAHPVGKWLGSYQKLDPKAQDDPSSNEHGLAVTSAFLFGPIVPGTPANRPFSYVDHLRVLDKDSSKDDPFELYRTLGLIEQVLISRKYEFLNLSLGPDLPIEDTDVHAWTALIDDYLSDGSTLLTVAVGNNGEMDLSSGNARIQVPSDCVNAIAVGAASSSEADWTRASYSAIGPGRSPGVVKPDILAFGGSPKEYFHVLGPGTKAMLSPQLGTSFASPFALRNAVGIRAILGEELSPLAIKALLVHAAENAELEKSEVGWGKLPQDIMDIITCPEGIARIIYQGELRPGKHLRAPVPLPPYPMEGNVSIKATFCLVCGTDPQDACAYTKAGLTVTFRPNDEKTEPGKSHAKTKSFFHLKSYSSELEIRSDVGKWETVMHDESTMRGSGLKNPAFDIHYGARDSGGVPSGADKVKYALVVTVQAPRHKDLFNDILRNYSSILTQIQPEISLPIRV